MATGENLMRLHLLEMSYNTPSEVANNLNLLHKKFEVHSAAARDRNNSPSTWGGRCSPSGLRRPRCCNRPTPKYISCTGHVRWNRSSYGLGRTTSAVPTGHVRHSSWFPATTADCVCWCDRLAARSRLAATVTISSAGGHRSWSWKGQGEAGRKLAA